MLEELLTIMENNARISVKDLASLLNEEESTVENAIKDCEEKHIIAGYHTVINWDKSNTEIVKAIIAVTCTPEREAGYDHIAATIGKYPEVDSLYLMSGKADFLLIVNGRTMREVSQFLAHKIAPIEGVTATETMFVLREYKAAGVNVDLDKEDGERLLMTP